MQKLIQDFSIPAVFAGFITFLIGISACRFSHSSCTDFRCDCCSNYLMVLGLWFRHWFSGLILSWKFKYPVATAWSTAGLALIIATGSGYTLYEAIGAFLVCGLVTAILGFLESLKSTFLYSAKFDQCNACRRIIKIWDHTFCKYAKWLGLHSILTRCIYYFQTIMDTLLHCHHSNCRLVNCTTIYAIPCSNFHWALAKPVWIQPDFTWSAIFG